MSLSRHLNMLMASAVSASIALSPISVTPAHAQNAPAAEAPADAGWQKEFQVWRSVSKAGKVADYQSYLKTYPNGKFVSVAKQRIDGLNGVAADAKPVDAAQPEVQASKQAVDTMPAKTADAADADKVRDLELWRQVSKTGTQADYEKYLKAFPKGKFAKIAKTRVEGLIAKTEVPSEEPQAVADSAQADNAVPEEAQAEAQPQMQSQAEAADQATSSDDASQPEQAAAVTDEPQEQAKAPASSDWEQEYALWKAASDGNTVTEYEAYLSNYPKGKFAAIAQARIVQLAAAEAPAENIAEGDTQQVDQQASTVDQPVGQDQAQDLTQEQPQDQSQEQSTDPNKVLAYDDKSNEADQASQMDPNQDPNQAQPDDNTQVAANDSDMQNDNGAGQNVQPQQNVQFTEGTPEAEDEFLNREGRHEIQGRLTSLGYDTFGSDGAFGPNSRTAISNWQQDNGAPVNGYLSTDQITQIRKMSQVAYAEWLNAHPVVVERVRPRREKVVIIEERRNPALDAAIAVGVIGAVVGAHRVGRYRLGKRHGNRVKVIGRYNFGKCRKKHRC